MCYHLKLHVCSSGIAICCKSAKTYSRLWYNCMWYMQHFILNYILIRAEKQFTFWQFWVFPFIFLKNFFFFILFNFLSIFKILFIYLLIILKDMFLIYFWVLNSHLILFTDMDVVRILSSDHSRNFLTQGVLLNF